MMLKFVFVFAIFGSAYGFEGLALGGYGATNYIELVTSTKTCMGENIIPAIPSVIPAANPSWVSEYVDGSIYLCGGQVCLLINLVSLALQNHIFFTYYSKLIVFL